MDIQQAGSALAKLGPIAAVAIVSTGLAGYAIYSAGNVEESILQNNSQSVAALAASTVASQSEAREFRGEMRRHWQRSERIHERMTDLLRVICSSLSNGTPAQCYVEHPAPADD